jgi:hypothetical protein
MTAADFAAITNHKRFLCDDYVSVCARLSGRKLLPRYNEPRCASKAMEWR